ncbi:MAG: hypothetical protein JO257_00345 [Deltaproteobacteria bacterium]|nr:hypothetical protein [Deltaproteobacteria bacterium]
MRTHKQSSRTVPLTSTMPPPDPSDPLQTLDETQDFHLEPLEVEVQPGAENQEEIDAALDLSEADDDDDVDTYETRTADAEDTGELYGGHITRADSPERGVGANGDYVEADLGENWLETLEADAVEGGPAPEQEVDANDDQDVEAHHGTESGDRPVADKGSGGAGGL